MPTLQLAATCSVPQLNTGNLTRILTTVYGAEVGRQLWEQH